jgi:hypothetical protein
MTHDRKAAAQEIEHLEQMTGAPLSDVPVFLADQWGAGLRDMLTDLGVTLDREGARAALGGAYIMATLTLTGSVMPRSSVEAAAHVLRWLYDRGETCGD